MKDKVFHALVNLRIPLSDRQEKVFHALVNLRIPLSDRQKMVPCESFWHMDTTNCNLSKIWSKIIAIRFCETWNRILKACIALKPEGDEKWKPRNSINSDQLCLTSTRHFWKMYREWKFPNFQIYGFYNFFFCSKAWNLPNTLKILFFVLYDITYTQTTGNGNNYLNLPVN